MEARPLICMCQAQNMNTDWMPGIHICAVRTPCAVTMLMQLMAQSVMLAISCSMMKAGPYATLSLTRRYGGSGNKFYYLR